MQLKWKKRVINEQHQSYHEKLETWAACPNEVLTSKAKVERIHNSPPGPTGEAGLIGEPGPEGALGDNEQKGAKIQPGPSGDQGPQGDDGDQGAQGPKGEPGQAATGVKGEKGDQGADGDVGNRDPQGHKRERGVDGSPGSPGDPSPSVERELIPAKCAEDSNETQGQAQMNKAKAIDPVCSEPTAEIRNQKSIMRTRRLWSALKSRLKRGNKETGKARNKPSFIKRWFPCVCGSKTNSE